MQSLQRQAQLWADEFLITATLVDKTHQNDWKHVFHSDLEEQIREGGGGGILESRAESGDILHSGCSGNRRVCNPELNVTWKGFDQFHWA